MIELLKILLRFNPNSRSSAKECLQMPVFDSIRCPELELEAQQQVKVSIDSLGSFDYEIGKDLLYPSRKQYLKLIENEI